MKEKKTNDFKFPYIGNDRLEGFDVVSHNESHISVTLKCDFRIPSDLSNEKYHEIIYSILKTLEGLYFQKHDVFSDTGIQTYITIIKEAPASFFTFNNKKYNDFVSTIEMLISFLEEKGFNPKPIRWEQFNFLAKQFLGFNFTGKDFKLSSIEKNEFEIIFGKNNYVQSKSLNNHSEPEDLQNSGYPFPPNLLNFLYKIENHKGKMYHQVIYIPEQKSELKRIEGELRRAAAKYGEQEIEEIESFKLRISERDELLIYAHFNIIYSAKDYKQLNKASRYIDNSVSDWGITPSKNNFNQYDLYYAAFPGNAIMLDQNNLSKTTVRPLISFLFKNTLF